MTNWSDEAVSKAGKAYMNSGHDQGYYSDRALRAALSSLTLDDLMQVDEVREYAAENAKLLALLEECEGVLTYYRRVDNYMAKLADNGRFDFRNTDIHKDGGSHAREMLTKLRAAGIGGK